MKRIGLAIVCLFVFNKISFAANNSAIQNNETIKIYVDYNQLLRGMTDFGYSKNHSNRSVRMKIFQFKRPIASNEVIKEMEKRGYRPAESSELIAFSKEYSDSFVVALGSFKTDWISDWCMVPVLRDVRILGRRFILEPYFSMWNPDWKFLAICKS